MFGTPNATRGIVRFSNETAAVFERFAPARTVKPSVIAQSRRAATSTLRQNSVDDVAVHVGQTHVPPAEAVRELPMIHAQQMQDRRV